MFYAKILSFGIVYFFLTGLFKKAKFTEDRNNVLIKNDKKFSKLIYIVLDALRFDYTVKPKYPRDYIHNKMLFLDSIKKFHALSVCGIPTSTTCRITGLLTGSPSNFLEGAKTFLNSRILIDNLVEQTYKKMSVAFYGDATWISFFPYLKNGLNSTFDPYTKNNLLKEENRVMNDMLRDFGTCDAIFCHLITLDSFGHTFGTNHKVIEETLIRFDKFIKEIYEKMDDKTLLVITSDHGVTNEGAHGGVTKEEMSSFVSFISKTDLEIKKPHTTVIEMRNKMLSQYYDIENPFIETYHPYTIIHQDDILPTVCYLMGLSIPSNSYGNFIHELVGCKKAYIYFLDIKQRLQEKMRVKGCIRSTNNNFNLHHYTLSRNIYEVVTGNDVPKLVLCLILFLYVFLRYIRINISYRTITLIFLCLCVSISVMSVINEDVFWLFCFILFNPSLMNLLCSIFYIGIDTKYGIFNEWIAQFKSQFFLDSYFNGSYTVVYLLFIFFMGKVVIKKKYIFSLRKIFTDQAINLPSTNNLILIFCLYKYFFKSHFTVEFNLLLVSTFMSMEILCLVIFRPLESLFLLYISRNLQVYHDTSSLYILLNLSIGYTGMVKQIQSINYDIVYVFSSNPTIYEVILPVLVYFIYPRYILFKKFTRRGLVKKKDFLKEYFIIDLINLMIVLSSSYYFFDSMVFYFHFASRCFFICFYFIVDIFMSFII